MSELDAGERPVLVRVLVAAAAAAAVPFAVTAQGPPDDAALSRVERTSGLREWNCIDQCDGYLLTVATPAGEAEVDIVVTATSASGTPPVDADTSISGTPTYLGEACGVLAPGDGIALVERGTCTFQAKFDNIKAAGYDAGIVFKTSGPTAWLRSRCWPAWTCPTCS